MQRVQLLLVAVIAALCGKAVAQPCFTSADDCFSGGTDPALTTYDTCCQPLLDDNTVRRSFVSNGRCFECIQIGLDQSQYTLDESNTVYTRRLRLLAPTGYTGFARPRLRLNGIPGTAGVNDFSLVTSDILLTNPVAGIDVAITISVDGIAGEPPEEFTITFQPPGVSGNADPLFLFRNTTVTIIDTDKPTYQFDQGDYVESEGAGNAIVVNVQQIVSSVQDVHLLLVPLTYDQYSARAVNDSTLAAIDVYHGSRPDAAEHNVRQDFDMMVRKVFFSANSGTSASQRVSFPIMDDAIDEEPEGFIIVLYRDDNLTTIDIAFTPNLRTTLGRINDDDPFFFGFNLNNATYDEARNEGLQEILYSPAPGNKTEKVFTFSLNLNALVGGFEFGATGDISFGAGVIRPTFTFDPNAAPEDRIVTFSVIRDNVVEGQEIGQLQIAPSTSFDGFTPLFQNFRIIINDANMAVFNLSAPPVVTEGQNLTFNAMVFLTAPSGGTTFQIEIDIMELGITATPFADFRRNAAPSVIFQGTERPGCCVEPVGYQVRNDNVAEPDEVFTISIARSITSAAIPVDFVVQQVNVTIIDDDMARIGFENDTFTYGEAAGFAELPVAVLGTTTLGGEVTVRFSTADLTANAGLDYNTTVMELVFSAAVRRHVVRVPIINDSFSERSERFTAGLTLVENNGINVVINPPLAFVTIEDDDVTVIGFARDNVTVNEADGSAILTVRVLMGVLAPGATAVVEFTTANRPPSDTSAIAPGDYTSVTRQLSFSSTATEFNVSVPIINDNFTELTESFLANLILVSADGRVNIAPPQATVNIENDDVTVIGFTRNNVTVNEADGSATLTVRVLMGVLAPGATAVVEFTTANRPPSDTSAIAPGDYTNVTRQLSFSSSVTEFNVSVPIINDNFTELTESFLANLILVSAVGNVNIAPPQATVNIENDDVTVIGFARDNVTVNEADGSAILTVRVLMGVLAPGATAVVEFTTANRPPSDTSAIAPGDYTSVTRQLSFSSSVTEFNVSVPIINDTLTELTESFLANLRLISADGNVNIAPPQATVNIQNDDVTVIGFAHNMVTVNEADGSAILTVRVLMGVLAPGATAVVEFTTANRPPSDTSAIAPGDYTNVTRQLSFSSSVTEFNVSVPIINDNFTELTESFLANLRLVSTNGRVNIAPSQATVSIQSEDQLIIGFVENTYRGREGEFVRPEIRILSGMLAPGLSASVRFISLPNTATTPADYVNTIMPLLFTNAITTHTVPVPLNADSIYENTESFFGVISRDPTPLNVLVSPNQATLLINDTTSIIIRFRVPNIDVPESVGTAVLETEVFGGQLGRDVTLQFNTADGSAIAGMDYTSISGSITFTPTVSQQNISVPIIDDLIREDRETLTVTLTNAPARVMLIPGQGTIGILDNDDVVIGFDPVSNSFAEESGRGEVTVRIISGTLANSVAVLLSTASGTAESGVDFTPLQDVRLVFNSTTNSITVPITIINDILTENDETFTASIRLVMAEQRVMLAPDEAMVTITDTDRAVIGFTSPTYSAVEGTGRIEVMVRVLQGMLGKDFNINLNTFDHGQDGQIMGSGSDLTPITTRGLLFNQANTLRPVTISLVNDMRLENNETFRAQLVSVLADPDITIAPDEAGLTILDDDSAVIGFEQLMYSDEEGQFVDIVFGLRSGPLNVQYPVEVAVSPQSASVNDYSCANQSPYVFNNANTRFTIRCTLTDDSTVEGTEDFSLSLSSPSILPVMLDPNMTVVTIQDNDRTLFSFARPMYAFSEGAGTGFVTIIRTGNSTISQNIMLSGPLQQGNITREVTFAPGVTAVNVSFNIIDDNVALEPVEMLMFELSTIPGQIGTALGTPDGTIVNIEDDDMVTLRIIAPPTINEDGNSALIRVAISNPIAQQLNVPVMTAQSPANNPAQAGEDYTSVNQVISFPARGTQIVSFNVPITNDDRVEVDREPFLIRFNIPASSPFASSIVALTGQATIDIIDDDTVTIGFVNAPYSTNEADRMVNYTVRILRGRLARSVTVTLTDVPGTAMRGADYIPVNRDLVFDSTTNQFMMPVTIIDDDLLEPTERFQLTLATLDGDVMLNPDRADVDILDNDRVTIGFTMTVFNTSEDQPTVEVCAIVRTGMIAPSRTVMVSIQTLPGTATGGGVDYGDINQTLSFTNTMTRSCVNISITPDNVYENTESLRVTLNTTDQDVNIVPDDAVVNIADNDGITIGWIQTTLTVAEDAGSGEIMPQICFRVLSTPDNRQATITVVARPVEGTATAGDDYVNGSMTYQWLPSQPDRCFPIRPVDDDVVEDPEQFRVLLETNADRVTVNPSTSVITITDNDVPEFRFERPSYSTPENNGSVEVCVVTDSPRERDVIVRVETRNTGTATEGVDYTRTVTNVRFEPDDGRQCIDIPITEDDDIEGPESFPVTIQNNTDITAGPDTTVTITDVGMVTIGFDPILYRVNEGDGVATLTIRVLAGNLAKEARLFFSTENGTAQESSDYVNIQDRQLTLDASTSSVTTNITIVSDSRQENIERLFANLRLASPDSQILVQPDRATVDIVDDDVVTVGFVETAVNVSEDQARRDVCFRVLSGQLARDIVVNVRTQDGTAVAPGDYAAGNIDYTLSPSTLQQCFPLRPNNDNIVENDEQLTLTLSTTEMRVTTSPDTATVTIVDNDRASFMIERPLYVANESDPRVEVCVVTNSTLQRNITVTLTAQNGSATAGEDFMRFESVPLVFTPGTMRVCANIIPIDDDLTEPTESFPVVLDSPDPDVDTGPPSTVELLDGDSVVIGFRQTAVSVNENDGIATLVVAVLRGTLAKPIMVVFSTNDLTATEPSDYTSTTRTLRFDATDTEFTVNVPIINDTRLENDEDLRARLMLTAPSTQVFVSPENATVTIRDDDMVTVGFVETAVNVSEDQARRDVCFRVLSGQLDRDIVVNVRTQDGTAVAPGDYAAGNIDYTLSPSTLQQCFPVRPNNDNIVENDEQLTLTLSTTEMRVTTSPDTATVTIVDNDRATFMIERPLYVANESDPRVEVCVVTNSTLQRTITVTLTARNGSATAGEDFMRFESVPLVFTPGTMRVCANIIPIDDDLTEGPERFPVVLESPDPDVDTGPPSIVELRDNDAVVIGFAQTQYSVNENGGSQGLVIIVRMGTLATPVTVLLSTANGTASAPSDYSAIPSQPVTLDATLMSLTILVPIIDDNRLEIDETFVGRLVLQGVNDLVTIDPEETTVTIVDNDMINVGFIRTSVSVNESQPVENVCFEVTSGVLDREVMVAIWPVDGVAKAGADFVGGSMSFTLTPSMTRDCFPVRPIDDNIVEAVEMFTLQLNSTTERVTTNPDMATITILDNDRALFTIEEPRYVANETDPRIEVCVVTMSMFERILEVRLTTGSGTATSGVDFQPLNQRLFFNTDASKRCDNIIPIPDNVTEGSETFPITLTSPDPAVDTGPPSVIELVDTDMVVIGFRQTAVSVGESDGQVMLEIAVLMGTLNKPVNITFSTSDLSAVAPGDYTAITNRLLMFNSITMSIRVSVPIISDNRLENAEMFRATIQLQGVDAQVRVAPERATVTITDDEDVRVGFTQPEYRFGEDSGNGSVTVQLTGTIDVPVTVRVTGGPSTQPDIQRSAAGIMSTITFLPGAPSTITIPFTITDDGVALEPDEQYNVTLNVISPNMGVSVGNFETTRVVVVDNDDVSVRILNMSRETVMEDEGPARICLEKDSATSGPVTVNFSTRDGSATAPSDYTRTVQPVTFPASANAVVCVDVPITDDDRTEPTEQFDVVVTPRTPGVTVEEPSTVTVEIEDDDEVNMQVCTVRPDLTLEPLHDVNSDPTSSYRFARSCEHRLVASNCDDDLDLSITVDFLPNNFESGRINIMFNGHQIRIREDLVVDPAQSPNSSLIEYINNASRVEIRLPTVPLTLVRTSTELSVVIESDMTGFSDLSGLCGTPDGRLLFSDCRTVASTEGDDNNLNQFIDSFRVNPAEQTLRPQSAECGLIRNDTVVGDPLFTVPIHGNFSVTGASSLSLCYEIHGTADAYYNLISDECTTVNAHYIAARGASFLNVIDQISVVAVGNDQQCRQISVNLDTCIPQINGMELPLVSGRRGPYNSDGINIRVYRNRVRIAVPNCADTMLVMWVTCQNLDLENPIDGSMLRNISMIKYVVSRGLNLQEFSHGLLGQFWNIPITVTKYNGPTRGEVSNANLYTVTVNHPRSSRPRSFVGRLHDLTWEFTPTSCLYVGNRQAGTIGEVASPNDPVIEGSYRDYQVDSAFDNTYDFAVFNSTCT